ncbi:hypothetical protein BDW22DRAFT_11993 [Trametopsis cervina]|nr:hypothetical protein BDW22DRAFT_11993 [Trametopsis cervina]
MEVLAARAPRFTAAMDTIERARVTTVRACFELAACTLFFYDYILTIRQEVNCIWRRPKSLSAVLFILCRYIVFAERTMMAVIVVFMERMRYRTSMLADKANITATRTSTPRFPTYFNLITVIVLHSALTVFAAVRIYAIWRKNVFLGGLVLILGLTYPAYNIFMLDMNLRKSACMGSHTAELMCRSAAVIPYYYFIPAICNEGLVVALTWSKTIGIYWVSLRSNIRTRKSLSYLLLRDGTSYFIAFMPLSIMGILLPFKFKFSSVSAGISVFVDVCPAILIARFILNLRQDATPATGELSNERAELHSIVFAAQGSSPLIGNLGAATYAPGNYDESDDE